MLADFRFLMPTVRAIAPKDEVFKCLLWYLDKSVSTGRKSVPLTPERPPSLSLDDTELGMILVRSTATVI